MKTKTITLHEFEELPEDIQQKVLDKYRDINVYLSSWHDFALEEAKERLESMGFDNPEIAYRGFWSQGDGASFTCKRVDVFTFLKAHKMITPYRPLIKALQNEDIEVIVSVDRISHYYSHEYTVTVHTEINWLVDEEPRRYITLEKLEGTLREAILDVVRVQSRKIYRDLESEYEGLTSDECVKDTLLANEYTFTADGEMDNE